METTNTAPVEEPQTNIVGQETVIVETPDGKIEQQPDGEVQANLAPPEWGRDMMARAAERAVAVLAERFGVDEQIITIAMVCHEANAAYCLGHGDCSHIRFLHSPEWQQRSIVNGVLFHQANPNASPAASHEKWWADKKADKWVYGPEKDSVKKLHPCCVPWAELPAMQKRKDVLFKAICGALLGHS
jgi:hypothetical protein